MERIASMTIPIGQFLAAMKMKTAEFVSSMKRLHGGDLTTHGDMALPTI
jgi:hypothetical protein